MAEKGGSVVWAALFIIGLLIGVGAGYGVAGSIYGRKISDLEKAKTSLETQVSELKSDKEELLEMVDKLEETREDLESEISELRAEVEELEGKVPADLWDLYFKYIKPKKFVDLTHSFRPGIPHWPGFPDSKREILYWYEPGVGTMGSGFYAEYFCHVGQWGTHCDPPAHFIKGLMTIDELPVKWMVLPLVVIDVHEKVAENPDYVLTVDDIKAWEAKHGPIPEGAFVAMRTDWSKRWPDMAAMRNEDAEGVAHYPGWTLSALKYLFEVRNVTAIGHEPTDTDPGVNTTRGIYACESYVLSLNKYQIELLTNLDKVPEYGALVIVTWPKPENGSGFPARVFAIIPG